MKRDNVSLIGLMVSTLTVRGYSVPLCNVVYFRLHGIVFVFAAFVAEFSDPGSMKPLRLVLASRLLINFGIAVSILPPHELFATFS